MVQGWECTSYVPPYPHPLPRLRPARRDFAKAGVRGEGDNRLFSDIWEDLMETEHLEKRFGILAVEKGFVTADQVIEALKTQVIEDLEKGKHRLIGRILLEKGLITLSQIDSVLESIGKSLPILKELEE